MNFARSKRGRPAQQDVQHPGAGPRNPHATARILARSWRELTGGTGRDRDTERRTLIAVSGGGDSAGMLRALVSAVGRAGEVFVVGHVVHDMRDRVSALQDCTWVRDLAGRLKLPFIQGEVRARPEGGNYEAVARRLRYAEFARMARAEGCGYIATAHHADDQLETMLMALIRGAGPRGLAGIAPRRRVDGVMVIRPALAVARADLQEVSLSSGEFWREDSTNTDESRLRAAIRARVLPELERLRSRAAERAGRAAVLVRGAARLVEREARALLGRTDRARGLVWQRAQLRQSPEVVLGELLHLAQRDLAGGMGADRMKSNAVVHVARAIRDSKTHPRSFVMGNLAVEVTARSVTIRNATSLKDITT